VIFQCALWRVGTVFAGGIQGVADSNAPHGEIVEVSIIGKLACVNKESYTRGPCQGVS